MSEYLPEEVIVETLWRLPIKTILRCTSVCKLWYSIITNPNFISTHFHRSVSWRNNLLLLSERHNAKNFKLHFDDDDFEEYMRLDPPFGCMVNLGVAGSCNGVICLYTYEYNDVYFTFILWNPSIRKYLLVPSPQFLPNCCVIFVGFGFDSKTHNFKVLRMLNNLSTQLYSLKENSWKDITDITPKFTCPPYLTNSIFVNGALHWIALRTNFKSQYVIMVFDLKDEAFHEIMLPQLVEGCLGSRVGVFGESSIAVFHRKRPGQTDIWVMKEYGVVASWMMLGSVRKACKGRLSVLGFRNNGDVLLQFYGEHNIASQNIHSPQFKICSFTADFDYVNHSYEESLALLGKEYDASAAATSGRSDAKRMKISN